MAKRIPTMEMGGRLLGGALLGGGGKHGEGRLNLRSPRGGR